MEFPTAASRTHSAELGNIEDHSETGHSHPKPFGSSEHGVVAGGAHRVSPVVDRVHSPVSPVNSPLPVHPHAEPVHAHGFASRPHSTREPSMLSLRSVEQSPSETYDKQSLSHKTERHHKSADEHHNDSEKRIVPLQKNGKYWAHLKILGDGLEKDGYELVDRGFDSKDAIRSHNIVSACPYCTKPAIVKELNNHLYQECPMLKQCDSCKEKVLVNDLNDHLVDKCEKKQQMARCLRCRAAVPAKKLSSHMKQQTCPDVSQDRTKAVCPLCNEIVMNTADGWSHHLLSDENGCRKNKRRVKALKWTQHGEGRSDHQPDLRSLSEHL